MSEHPTSQLLARYQERTLPSDVFLKIHRHLSACSVCREKCDAAERSVEDYASLQDAFLPAADDAPYHLSMVETEAYVNKVLDEIDLEIAESHLELCASCGDRVRQLKNARRGTATVALFPRPVDPKPAARARALPNSFLWFSPLRLRHVAALCAVAFIIFATLILVWRQRDDRSKSQAGAGIVNNNGNQNPASQNGQSNGATGNENGHDSEWVGNSTPPGDNSSTTLPARSVLLMNDNGREISLDEKGNLSGLADLPADLRQEIKEMLVTGKVRRPPAPAELGGAPGTLMSESAGNGLPFRLISPISKVIRDNRPTFRWQPLKGADSYVVTVADARLDQVLTSEPLSATVWKMQQPLKYGDTYTWQVTAYRDGEKITSPVLPAAEAKFKVLPDDKVRALRRAEKAYAGSHLTLAVLYLRAGLFDEAERELKALARSNPQSPTAKSLLRSLGR
jgi:hypothetical protein